jgi:hypothetical protein
LTWVKKLEILRQFCGYCESNEWLAKNWAKKVPTPKNIKASDREPYTPAEAVKIIAACDLIALGSYERLRARNGAPAAVHGTPYLGRGTAREDRMRRGEIYRRTTKNGKPIKLPVHADLQAALDILPYRGARPGRTARFTSGAATARAVPSSETLPEPWPRFSKIGRAGCLLAPLRHTIAPEVLELGGTFE